jgi:hypothetical protein
VDALDAEFAHTPAGLAHVVTVAPRTKPPSIDSWSRLERYSQSDLLLAWARQARRPVLHLDLRNEQIEFAHPMDKESEYCRLLLGASIRTLT